MGIQARKQNESVSQAEQSAFAEFFRQNPRYDTSENGKNLAEYLLNTWAVIINAESLAVAQQKLREANLLTPLSESQIKYKAVMSNYPEEQLDQFSKWFEKQSTLVNTGDEAFENAASLLTELRGRQINPDSIYAAIGRLQWRGAQVHFVQATKSDRPPEMRAGKINHAANAPEHKPGVLYRRDEVNQDPLRNVRHKPDPVKETPTAVEQRWQDRADGVRGATHSITEQALRIVVTKPGSSDIDWERTLAARERFVGADRSVR